MTPLLASDSGARTKILSLQDCFGSLIKSWSQGQSWEFACRLSDEALKEYAAFIRVALNPICSSSKIPDCLTTVNFQTAAEPPRMLE